MNKKNKKSRGGNKGLVAALVLAVLVLIAVVCCLVMLESEDQEPANESTSTAAAESSVAPSVSVDDTQPQSPQQETSAAPADVSIEAIQESNKDLGQGLSVSDIGSYAGVYMEDGSDDIVSGVLMLVVSNNCEYPLEFAQIELPVDDTIATFTVSTLPVGASAVLLEQNRMSYKENMTFGDAQIKYVSYFDEELSLCQDKIQIQGLDGVLNIINITDEDIVGDIEIYYKNSSQDMFYGGITYRVRISGGLKAKEVRQIVSDHYSESGSTLMFAKCG